MRFRTWLLAEAKAKQFVRNLENLTADNEAFRRVVYTAKHCQLVVMALRPGEEIGEEVHDVDQFFRVEAGGGEAVIGGTRKTLRPGFAVLVPAGTRHNIINTRDVPLKLYTIYAPAQHRDGLLQKTKPLGE